MELDALVCLYCKELQYSFNNMRIIANKPHKSLRRLEMLSEAIGLTIGFLAVFSHAPQDTYTSTIQNRLSEILYGLTTWRKEGFRTNVIFMGV